MPGFGVGGVAKAALMGGAAGAAFGYAKNKMGKNRQGVPHGAYHGQPAYGQAGQPVYAAGAVPGRTIIINPGAQPQAGQYARGANAPSGDNTMTIVMVGVGIMIL